MNYLELANRISGMSGSDAEIAAELSAPTYRSGVMVTSRSLMAALGIEAAAAVKDALVEMGTPGEMVLDLLKPESGGVDIGSDKAREFVAQLVSGRVLTREQAKLILAAAEEPGTTVSEQDVKTARAIGKKATSAATRQSAADTYNAIIEACEAYDRELARGNVDALLETP